MEVNCNSRQLTIPLHTDRIKLVGVESEKLLAAGERGRYVAEIQKFQSLKPVPNLELLLCIRKTGFLKS